MRNAIFESIYRRNSWHGAETRSGPGSSLGATSLLQRILPELMEGIGARSILDASCGEGYWMPDLPGYVGVDVSSIALLAARERHPDRRYMLADICTDELPMVDLVFCRDALQHLSLAEGLVALRNFRLTGATWLMCSSFEDGLNTNISAGGYYEPDMTAPPFSLGVPWLVVEDGFWDDCRPYPTKFMGVWTFAS